MNNLVAAGRFLLIVILAGYVLHLPLPGAAQENYPAPIAPESAKLLLLEAMQRNEKTRLFLVAPPEHTEEQRNWCQQFLADLETGGAISMVEPAARSERYNDPVFQPWQRSCPMLAMNAKLGYSPHILHDEHPQLSFHMSGGRPLDGYEYGTRSFKLYVTDIDNNPTNGKEVVFYSERAYSYWEAILKAPGLKLALPPVDANWNDFLPPEKAPAMSTYWGSNYKASVTRLPCVRCSRPGGSL